LLEFEKELAKEHPGEDEDWFGKFLHKRPKILNQPTWHASRLWF
jgi:hypothetical protein